MEKKVQNSTIITWQSNDRCFGEWIKVKDALQSKAGDLPHVKEGEIWWASIGENVGAEINGKGPSFMRPVLIYKKFAASCCLVIPLTSRRHFGSWYISFPFRRKTSYAVLNQIRLISSLRFASKMGELSAQKFEMVKRALLKLLG